MEYLTTVSVSPEASFYKIEGESQTQVERYIATTPQSRNICNRSELLGCEYTSQLREAMVATLSHAPFAERIQAHDESRVCVLNFLRGGLNFDLRNALHQAYGLNRHSSAFMSSQRYKVDGQWQVNENMYRKLKIPRGAMMLVADVVATGVTLDSGFFVLLDHLLAIGSSIQHLVFFTFGCQKVEDYLTRYDELFRKHFPDYEGMSIVYFEGKFRLVDSFPNDTFRIAIHGTDLVRRDCLLAPEFELSQYESPAYPLERCTIYDAGSRAFDIPGYIEDVLEYWEEVAKLASQGLTLTDALIERWPEAEYVSHEQFLSHKRESWRGVKDTLLNKLYAGYKARWTEEFTQEAQSSEALAKLCEERISTLKSLME